MQNLNKSDIKRIEKIKIFLKNANLQLKSKSVEEIENIFNSQEKIINAITDLETKNNLLRQFIVLKNSVTYATNKFNNIIEKLIECEKLLDWKNKEEIILFFNKIDNDISIILDMKMRHLLIWQSNYWKTRRLDDYYINYTKNILDNVENDRKITWNTIKEVENFFRTLNNDISEINNTEIKTWILSFSNILKYDAIQMIELREPK